MPPETMARAFEPFFTTKPTGQGTGLGLSSVYGFLKQSGGHITLYSEPGQGTTIRIYLPSVAEEHDDAKPSAMDLPAVLPRGKGERILVAEDDERVRRVTVARLGALGYVVEEAKDGPAALAALQQGPAFDLLFTDMVMPGGLSGAELAAEARRRYPGLRVLFTSGYAEPDAVRQADAESRNWLRKPYMAADLARKLRAIFERESIDS
jgi:CheY-like chemotaxis protein